MLWTSLFLAGAALTRPEGLLFAGCCFAWYAVARCPLVSASAVPNGLRTRLARWVRRLNWREMVCLVVPFVAVVGAHFLFRYAYYGEWLPNTYYAKHVRPWYDLGLRYLVAAALETGLYLLLPLTVLSLIRGWRTQRNLTYALPLLCIVLHMAYIARIGGDHFEYRPLDFYWPLLAVPAVEGIVHLGTCISAFVRRLLARPRLWVGTRCCAIVLFLPILFYASVVQGTLLLEGAKINTRVLMRHVELNRENAGELLGVPGMPLFIAISNDLRAKLARQGVGLRFVEHREFADSRIPVWQPYENMERGVIPPDALMERPDVGIPPYYVPDLKIIDRLGLTDATIARNPVNHPNEKRGMAHDRRPPPGYLDQRGVNFVIYPSVSSETEALSRAPYAVKVGPELWMPFHASSRSWVKERFATVSYRAWKPPRGGLANRTPVVGKPFAVALTWKDELPPGFKRSRWQWQRSAGTETESWIDIPDKPGPSFRYTPTEDDIGCRLRAYAVYTNADDRQSKVVTPTTDPVIGNDRDR